MILGNRCFAAFAGLLGGLTVLSGQPATAPAPLAPIQPQAPRGDTFTFAGTTESPDASATGNANDLLTVSFEDQAIRDIIAAIADLNNLNVVVPEELEGTTTIKLRNVTWQQIFDVILQPVDYTWSEDRNIIKVLSVEDKDLAPVETKIYIINYAEAAQMQTVIAPLIDAAGGGRVQVDQRNNALIVVERPDRLNNIANIISALDRPNYQVMIESKFIEVTGRDSKNLGINWSSLGGQAFSAGPVSREWSNSNTKTAETGDSQNISNAGAAISQLQDLAYSAAEGRIDTALFSASAFQVIVSALDTKSDVELVSNPTVVTMNNVPAIINIGEEFPIPQYTYNDQRGVFEVSGFEYKPIGIILKVTPSVNNAGVVLLNVNPEISSRSGVVSFGANEGSGAQIPIITTRKTQSVVSVKDGYTLAIGGLMERTTGYGGNRVPLLGDIPLLGKLFRSKSDSEDRRNLIIFITAKVLSPDGATYEDVFNARELWDMGVRSDDLPGADLSPEDEALYRRLRAQRDALEDLNRRVLLHRTGETLERQDENLKEGGRPTKRRRLN